MTNSSHTVRVGEGNSSVVLLLSSSHHEWGKALSRKRILINHPFICITRLNCQKSLANLMSFYSSCRDQQYFRNAYMQQLLAKTHPPYSHQVHVYAGLFGAPSFLYSGGSSVPLHGVGSPLNREKGSSYLNSKGLWIQNRNLPNQVCSKLVAQAFFTRINSFH